MLKFERSEGWSAGQFKNIKVETLTVHSKALKNNPLGDSHIRSVPIIQPKQVAPGESLPVVFVLAGFTGVGAKYLNIRFKEPSFADVLDQLIGIRKAPRAIYVLVDAMTYWGGSQFLNSKGTGRYSDFLIKELVSGININYNVKKGIKYWALMGGSSGGYGSLWHFWHHADIWGKAVAIAPDSFFEASLLPEIRSALPVLKRFGGVKGVKKEIEAGRFMNRRDAQSVLNAIGMGTCYSPGAKGEVAWPVDLDTGVLKAKSWSQWVKFDPIEFLKAKPKGQRFSQNHRVYLDVGDSDQYALQLGSRQIRNLLKKQKVGCDYSEFKGNHFDISSRRPQALEWLYGQWS